MNIFATIQNVFGASTSGRPVQLKILTSTFDYSYSNCGVFTNSTFTTSTLAAGTATTAFTASDRLSNVALTINSNIGQFTTN